MKLTDANNNTEIEIAASAIVSVREYPPGQTNVSTTDPSFPIIQCAESVDEVRRRKKEELGQ